MKNKELEIAIKLAGGRPGLAKLLGISPQAVHKYTKHGEMSPEKASEAERIFNGKVMAEKLCPSFPWPNRKAA